jgi:hypothetical protein
LSRETFVQPFSANEGSSGVRLEGSFRVCATPNDRSPLRWVRRRKVVPGVPKQLLGYGVAVVTQILIFPVFGLHPTLAQNLQMGAAFTGISIVRSFALRRLFEAIRVRPQTRDRPSTSLGSGP